MLAALYAVLTTVLAPISYGPLQFRISEAMCILPYFLPFTSWGLFLGCAAANIVSSAGVLDIVFGSLATLISCFSVALCGRLGRGSVKSRVLACLVPAVINGLVIGAVLSLAAGLDPLHESGAFWVFAGQVALGELGVMFAVGLPLSAWLPKQKFFTMPY